MNSSKSTFWHVYLELHWPHDRFCLGWQVIHPTEENDCLTISIYGLILTLTLDITSID